MSEGLEQFTEEVKAIWEQKAIVDNLKDRLAEESKKLTKLKTDALKALQAGELDKFSVPGFGTISCLQKMSVKVPSDPSDKKKLFDYISRTKGEDVLFNMTSIHSNKLNSFYKEEFELAKERKDIEWRLPGVPEPKPYFELGMRKG